MLCNERVILQLADGYLCHLAQSVPNFLLRVTWGIRHPVLPSIVKSQSIVLLAWQLQSAIIDGMNLHSG